MHLCAVGDGAHRAVHASRSSPHGEVGEVRVQENLGATAVGENDYIIECHSWWCINDGYHYSRHDDHDETCADRHRGVAHTY